MPLSTSLTTVVVLLLILGFIVLVPLVLILPLTLICNKKREKIQGIKYPVTFGRIIGNSVIFSIGFFLVGFLTALPIGILSEFSGKYSTLVTILDVIVRTSIMMCVMFVREMNRKIKVKKT